MKKSMIIIFVISLLLFAGRVAAGDKLPDPSKMKYGVVTIGYNGGGIPRYVINLFDSLGDVLSYMNKYYGNSTSYPAWVIEFNQIKLKRRDALTLEEKP